MIDLEPKDLQRFWIKVEKTGTCWNWKGAKTRGYGHFRLNRKMVYAHRISFELTKGEIPIGLNLDHLCRNPLCVNPNHLEAVTQRTNALRGISIISNNFKKTHCKRGHKLSGSNLINWYLRNGHRACRTCKNADSYRYYTNKKK